MIDVEHRPPRIRRSATAAARCIAVASAALLLIVACGWIPGVVGTAVAAVLPWLGLVLLALVVAALLRARRVIVLVVVPALLWGAGDGTGVSRAPRSDERGVGIRIRVDRS